MNLKDVFNFPWFGGGCININPIDPEKVKHCLELATLAPNSSNMQLWEFYQITNPGLMAKVSEACLGAVGCFYGFGNCCFCYSSGFV